MNTQCTATVCRRARRTMKRGSSLVLIPSTTHRGGSQMWDQGWNVSQRSQPSPSRNCIGRFDSPVTRSSGKNTRKRERRLSSWNLLWFNQRDRLVTLFLFFSSDTFADSSLLTDYRRKKFAYEFSWNTFSFILVNYLS